MIELVGAVGNNSVAGYRHLFHLLNLVFPCAPKTIYQLGTVLMSIKSIIIKYKVNEKRILNSSNTSLKKNYIGYLIVQYLIQCNTTCAQLFLTIYIYSIISY